MKKPIIPCALLLALCLSACNRPSDIPEEPEVTPPATEEQGRNPAFPDQSGQVVEHYIAPEPPFEYDNTYEYDPTDFVNPERGPYSAIWISFRDGEIPAVTPVDQIARVRENGISLTFLAIYLWDFVDKPISDAALEMLRQTLVNIRAAGTKAIIRFCYSWDTSEKYLQEPSDIQTSLGHIAQVKPLFEEFADIIYVVQAGMIGTYGEWAFTSRIVSEKDRARLVQALLEALPERRMVAVRTPVQKMRAVALIENAGQSMLSEADTVTAAEAYGPSPRARVGIHNDCVFWNEHDGGTYQGTSDRRYLAAESLYVPVGGEACYTADQGDAWCQCTPAYRNVKRYHFSYLSNHGSIVEIWKETGCFEDATARVGYRFVLDGAAFEGRFAADEDYLIRLCVTNYGYAPVVNAHDLEFVIENKNNPSERYVYKSGTDIRTWKGLHCYYHEERFILPSTLIPGTPYNIYIRVPDAEETLHDRPEYSIRFANRNMWDASRGANLIHTTIAR